MNIKKEEKTEDEIIIYNKFVNIERWNPTDQQYIIKKTGHWCLYVF